MNHQGAHFRIWEGMREGMQERMLYHESSRGSFQDLLRGSFQDFGGDTGGDAGGDAIT